MGILNGRRLRNDKKNRKIRTIITKKVPVEIIFKTKDGKKVKIKAMEIVEDLDCDLNEGRYY